MGGIDGFFRGPESFVGNTQSTKQAFVEWDGQFCRMGLCGCFFLGMGGEDLFVGLLRGPDSVCSLFLELKHVLDSL